MIQDPVRVNGGLISGASEADGRVHAYKGIPFAAPPVGDLRWRPPRPVVPWEGVHVADRFGPTCPQPPVARDSVMSLFSFEDPPECEISEDCLYLNVWTAADSPEERRPVIVSVYGGAHTLGSGSHAVTWGTRLALGGAVVVTFNYRLGALGYLAHPALTEESGTSGNYAGHDVLAALRWVHENIAAFGGDPDRVTLFGQSAGAHHVAAMMASPAASGLFHRAVGLGGGLFAGGMQRAAPMAELASAEQSGAEFMSGLGASTLDEMRRQPAEGMFGSFGQFAPIVDGVLLPKSVDEVFSAGEQAAVPLLVGFNTGEASALPFLDPRDLAGLRGFAGMAFGDSADEFLALYPAEGDEAARGQGYLLRRDGGFAFQVWRWASLHASSAGPVYFSCFGRAVPLPEGAVFREVLPPGGYGAWHGAELWYWFDTLDTKPFPWQDSDEELARTLSSALVRFAADGEPGQGWPQVTPEDPEVTLIGEDGRLTLGRLPNQAQLDFFTRQLARHAAPGMVRR